MARRWPQTGIVAAEIILAVLGLDHMVRAIVAFHGTGWLCCDCIPLQIVELLNRSMRENWYLAAAVFVLLWALEQRGWLPRNIRFWRALQAAIPVAALAMAAWLAPFFSSNR